MLWLQKQFIGRISRQLRNFGWRGNLANFSCPYCGDSSKNKRKARGFLYVRKKDDTYNFKCHNCNAGRSFQGFLQDLDASLYQDYLLENFKGGGAIFKDEEAPKPDAEVKGELDQVATKLSSLSSDHTIVQYAKSRFLPEAFYDDIYWTTNFKGLVEFFTKKEWKDLKEEGRLIFPLRTKTGELFGVVGRSLDSSLRYVTIKFCESLPKVYGLHRHSMYDTTYVLEGPVDSLFLPNSLAMCGTMLAFEELEKIAPKEKIVFIFDNEPRNVQVVSQVKKVIQKGYKVLIWNGIETRFKDINNLVCQGYDSEKLLQLVTGKVQQGLGATVEFNRWKRV